MASRKAGGTALRAACVALLLLLTPGGRAGAAEAYYLLLFGSQRTPNDPSYSHSWATFVRAVWDRPGPPRLEAHTISWLPRNLCIRVLALAPECGANLELHATLRYAAANDERVSLWGPYQIDRALYVRALDQIRLLESGRVLYKAVDTGYSSDHVSNCIHALSSLAEGYRLYILTPAWGETASFFVLGELAPWIIEPCTVHTWVAKALGLGAYPIIYRQPGEHPRSGALRRLLGRGPPVQATCGPPQ
jgi:hypothetical protein